ncbi:hypothetical protein Q763_13920 [Flavobacterium beibuense F44-8]|uniref:Lipoprotein n=1 Tax=Flavobacterium beibuense F44-8 TaxID=1406840 RepID=A0A0A2LJA7_9FLAO|nr:hypothetical protein [Flavobacterium beibuense]KGO79331.1 hypothetical protein Q763_13920 [Flavobacterium beibuense F44-8]
MKTIILLIFVCFILISCNNKTPNNILMNEITTNPVTKPPVLEVIPDTLVKVSKPFMLNGNECYWEHKLINGEEIIIKLFDYKTHTLLLKHHDVYPPPNYNKNNYLDEINKESLEDVSFDGYTDILLKSYSGNMAMNDRVYVYLFDHKEEKYISADDLEANRIERIDKKNRKLISSNEYRYGTDSIIHHFDKAGKIKFTDEFSHYRILEDTTWIDYKTYRKIVNGETVNERTQSDTIRWK